MSELDLHYQSEKEPGKRQKYQNWATAKGLQQVDGLTTSPYLDRVAEDHIEGRITSAQAIGLIDSYYEVAGDREAAEEHREADMVSARINALIGESAFTLAPEELQNIHGRLFEGVFDHAGQFRTQNFIKREWVLDGDTVTYGDYRYIGDNLERFVRRERLLRYATMDSDEAVSHLTKFVSDIWQVHPFNEGNTRSVAVFAIKYFRSLGFDTDNSAFQVHSWYFRNALVRANYTSVRKHVDADRSYLEDFLTSVLLGAQKEFRNRDLHIYADNLAVRDSLSGESLDKAILRMVEANPHITRQQMAAKCGTSVKTIERHLKALGIIFEGPAKTGRWENNS